MGGLTESQIKALLQNYQGRRDSSIGPSLTGKETLALMREIEALGQQAEGNVLDKFIATTAARRAAQPNPLKPNPERAS